jgi:hypothetical protein
VNLNNAHKNNEKLYASTRCDTFVWFSWKGRERRNEKQICEINLLLYDICWNKGCSMIKFEDFKIFFSLCNLTTTHISIVPTMVEAMHNIVL